MSKYLPEGITDDDLPGYWEVECPLCEDKLDETCELCHGTGTADEREVADYYAAQAAISDAEAARGY